MDGYLAAAVVLALALVVLLAVESAYSVRDAETVSFKGRSVVVVHCKAIYEANGTPVPGVMVYARGSAITDGKGACTVSADGDTFVRILAYPPTGGQRVVTVPVAEDANEVNVVIPI